MSRYTKIPIFRSSVEYKTAPNKRYYGTVRYPEIPLNFEDIYVFTEQGDRFDILAQEYYGDPRLWWVISTANKNLPQNSIHLPVGTQLRIPSNVGEAVDLFNQLNS